MRGQWGRLIRAIGGHVLPLLLVLSSCAAAHAQDFAQQVFDLPTRPGVTVRMLVLRPAAPKAVAILLAGGHGGLHIFPGGSIGWGENNFVVRTRTQFAEQGLLTVVVDAPSDRLSRPFLREFRGTPEHMADLRGVIAWARGQAKGPVWLVGTSRGTQSAAEAAVALAGPEGPDGIVLTSSILVDSDEPALTSLPLERVRVPVLVVHHEQDGCRVCPFRLVPQLMAKLQAAPHKDLLTFTGGITRGDACEALAHHGYNGIEAEVVSAIGRWVLAH